MSEIIISEISITPLKPKNGLVALASCILNGDLYLGSIGIYTKLSGGYRITYPTKKVGDMSINIYHPINREAGEQIEDAVVQEYISLMDNVIDDEVETNKDNE